MTYRFGFLAFAFLGVGSLLSCTGVTEPPPVFIVHVTPSSASLAVGQSFQLTATAKDREGNDLTGKTAAWTSANESVARVTSGGLILGVAPGSTTVSAVIEGIESHIDVTVTVATVATITIDSPAATLLAGSGAQLVAVSKDQAGSTISGMTFTWSSSDEKIARVSATGAVLGLSPGTVTISAAAGGRIGNTSISVVPGSPASGILAPDTAFLYVGATRQLSAVFRDLLGNVIPSLSASWNSSDAGAISISQNGVIEGKSLSGSAEISATVGIVVARSRAKVIAVQTIDLGDSHGCYLTTEGKLYCWGINTNGEAGAGIFTGLVPVPMKVAPSLTFSRLTVGASHGCAIATDAVLYCWGANESGEIGIGTTFRPQMVPIAVGGDMRFARVAAGRYHTCAVTISAETFCWGGGVRTPAKIETAVPFSSLSAGISFTCGLDAEGFAYCWGTNGRGQLGNGANTSSTTPVAVAGGIRFSMVSNGNDFACGLATDGVVYCWGNLPWRTGPAITSTVPVKVPGDLRFTSIASGRAHLCGVLTDGRAFCIGEGASGQLGNGARPFTIGDFVAVLPATPAASSFVGLTAGAFTSCAVTSQGAPYCWGSGSAIAIAIATVQPTPMVLAFP